MTENYKIPKENSLDSMEGIKIQPIEQDNNTDSVIENTERQSKLLEIKKILETGDFDFRLEVFDDLKDVGLGEIVNSKLMPVVAKKFVEYTDKKFLIFEESLKKDKRSAFNHISQEILHTLKFWSKKFMVNELRGKYYDAEIAFVAKLEEYFGNGFYSVAQGWKYLGDTDKQERAEVLMDRFYNKDRELDKWIIENIDQNIDNLRNAYKKLKEETVDMDVDSEKLISEVLAEVEKELQNISS